MKNLFQKAVIVFIAILVALPMSAQTAFDLTMTLVDSSNEEPLAFATVSLTPDGATKASKYVLSDEKGHVKIEKAKKGSYTLKVELMGYKAYSQAVKIEKTLNLGTIKVDPDNQMLNAATVSDVGNPIIVKEDTVEYNASSFKTTDNDMLEDLLKKLPGVEVAEDGTVTANGETIKKITIDGKTFFLDDPSLASKNIPAKIIQKVKVVEKKSDQAMFTGIDDGQEETIIDLSVRPGMMKGAFGNIMAGGGHDVPQSGYYTGDKNWKNDGWRWQGAGMVGNFKQNSQISLIFNGNNTNNRGFNDMAGSMMQGMRGGGGGMGRGGGGFGGNNGITTSWMGGLNGAFTLFDGDMDLGGNYLYNGSNRYVEEISSKITYLDSGDRLIYDNDGYNITNSQGHRFGIRLDHKFSENTSILFQPQVNFGGGDFTEFSDFATYTNDKNNITNKGFNRNTGYNDNWQTNGFLLFRQRLGKPGRTMSVMINYSFSGNELNGYNQSLTENWIDAENKWQNDTINQRYLNVSNSQSITARATYTEPIAKNLFLEANYSYGWRSNESTKDTWNSGYVDKFANGAFNYNSNGEKLDEIYSNNIVNKSQNHNAGMNFQYQKEKFRAQVGASVQPTITDNVTNGEVYHSSVVNWAPQAMVFYDINENANMRVFYMGRSSQPSTSQLMPVPDNTDPLNVRFGNPYLLPYFNHNLRSNFGYTNKQNFMSIRGNINGGIVQNPIVSALWYDKNGAQYTMPLNGPNSGNVSGNVFLNAPIAKSGFTIMNMIRANFSQSASFVGKDSFDMTQYYTAATADFNYELFNSHFGLGGSKDIDEYFTKSRTQTVGFTERLRLTYRNDFVELVVGGRTRYSKSWYTVAKQNQNATWSNQVDFSMNWTIPFGMTIKSDVDYNWYNGYTTPQDDEIILNAEISQLLFKKKFTIALKAYDILNQAKNLSITDNANYHQEVRNNTLGRYVIMSLTYRFGNMSNGSGRRGPGGPGFGGPGLRGPRR
jgi:hypothetical protein